MESSFNADLVHHSVHWNILSQTKGDNAIPQFLGSATFKVAHHLALNHNYLLWIYYKHRWDSVMTGTLT